jgi:hypothetical protein
MMKVGRSAEIMRRGERGDSISDHRESDLALPCILLPPSNGVLQVK